MGSGEVHAVTQTLVQLVREAGLTPADLDEMVHNAVAGLATTANNEGLDAQVGLLVRLGGKDAVKQIRDLIAERE